MVHEVYVPFSAAVVRSALAEPERVARCLPGFTTGPEDALRGARLRLRIGGSTITYRGELTMSDRGEGFAVEAEGAEARGSGRIRLTLAVVPRPVADGSGTTLAVSGAVDGTGRLAGFEPAQREAAARRILDRFAEALAEELERGEPRPAAGGIGEPDDNEPAIPGIPAPESEPGADFRHGIPGIDIPPPSLDPRAGLEEAAAEGAAMDDEGLVDEGLSDDFAQGMADGFGEAMEEGIGEGMADDLARTGDAPAEPEADVARRTMIGRSAEEVDHAPPRGRYAPRPAPGRVPAAAATLRWAAPVAAIAVASAVVVARRVLRRR
jgi:carbon monoxide dehydrogenase subunit G